VEQRVLAEAVGPVSVVGLGTWQLGADWGTVEDAEAMAILAASVDAGVTFFDTADVYGDGRSERRIAQFLASADVSDPEAITVATKLGRRAPQEPEHFTVDNFRSWVDRSRANLAVDTLDLVQLHCAPTACYSSDAVFDGLDALVDEGRVAAYGVSVETCDEALLALERPNVATIQIILNAFRLKPLEQVLPRAAEQGVGIIARVPLASGLLTNKFGTDSAFAADDHRNYNRNGDAFDVGETFSGVDYATGLEAAAEFAAVAAALPGQPTPAQVALRWVIQQPGVSTVIPGASSVNQARANADAAALPELSPATLADITAIYDSSIRSLVHHRW
jgi:aryl-alcohol dehydrogenase-like predicted oxidoreductase